MLVLKTPGIRRARQGPEGSSGFLESRPRNKLFLFGHGRLMYTVDTACPGWSKETPVCELAGCPLQVKEGPPGNQG